MKIMIITDKSVIIRKIKKSDYIYFPYKNSVLLYEDNKYYTIKNVKGIIVRRN